MTYFNEFMSHEEELVRDAAAMVERLMDTYQTRFVKKEELNNIINDILDVEKIDNIVGMSERKDNIKAAFNEIRAITSTLI